MSLTILDMSSVSSKYQVTIPKAVREAFPVRPGQRVMWLRMQTEKGYELVLRVG
jgi:looped-hinge helix DNA binding domain, AbrB family